MVTITADQEREWCSVPQAAKRLDVSRGTISKWLALGLLKLHSKTPGGNRRVSVASVAKLKGIMEATSTEEAAECGTEAAGE